MTSRWVTKKVGCFAGAAESPPVTPRGRLARAVVGILFLAAAAVAPRRALPIPRKPLAVLLGWFGISHVVASASGYRGCPEIGAIATLILDRPVATNCDIWERIDRLIGADR